MIKYTMVDSRIKRFTKKILKTIPPRASDHVWDIVSFTIFGVSMLLLYLSSTLLHSITHKKTKDILEIIDHSAIYVLIAGTYTPFLLGPLKGTLGFTLLVIGYQLPLVMVETKGTEHLQKGSLFKRLKPADIELSFSKAYIPANEKQLRA